MVLRTVEIATNRSLDELAVLFSQLKNSREGFRVFPGKTIVHLGYINPQNSRIPLQAVVSVNEGKAVVVYSIATHYMLLLYFLGIGSLIAWFAYVFLEWTYRIDLDLPPLFVLFFLSFPLLMLLAVKVVIPDQLNEFAAKVESVIKQSELPKEQSLSTVIRELFRNN